MISVKTGKEAELIIPQLFSNKIMPPEKMIRERCVPIILSMARIRFVPQRKGSGWGIDLTFDELYANLIEVFTKD
jgi:hypothetical protein